MTTRPATATSTAAALRRLYFTRFGFALVWAVLLFLNASSINPLTVALLLLYPAFDVAAAIVDIRSTPTEPTDATTRFANVAISTLTVAGLAIALPSGIPAVLRVWGAWAIAAGLVQLIVALRRRALGGQWAMIASGGLSVLAGGAFLVMASGARPSLTVMAGYALVGGIFFLVSALGLGRRSS